MCALKVAFVASDSPKAQSALSRLKSMFSENSPSEADVLVALGGDGFMLETLRKLIDRSKPVYGMNAGSVGFLMNEYGEEGLIERIEQAESIHLHPLQMSAICADGSSHDALAINEISLLRQTYQAAKVRISVDGKVRMPELICDGALVATPAGSTAYNLSAHGPIVPLGADILCLTPISAFRPRRWRGALLPHSASVRFEILEPEKRPVSATADNFEVRDVTEVLIEQDRDVDLTLLYDQGHGLADRIIAEQFVN